MLGALLRIIAIRPLLTLAILGIPVILLIAVGLITILALKFLVFVVLPIVLVIWVVRRIFWTRDLPPTPPSTM
jgi:type IV secretory pathway VirB3-like protein